MCVGRFQFRGGAMIQEAAHDFIIGSEGSQRLLIGGILASFGLLWRTPDLHDLKQDLTQLTRRIEIEGLARQVADGSFLLRYLLGQLSTELLEGRCLNLDTFVLHLCEDWN